MRHVSHFKYNNGTYYARYSEKLKALGMWRPRVSLGTKDLDEADDKVFELERISRQQLSGQATTTMPDMMQNTAQVMRPVHGIRGDIRFSDFAVTYLKMKEGQNRKRGTLTAIKDALSHFGRFMERDRYLWEITEEMVEGYRTWRNRTPIGNKYHKKPKRPSQKTIRNELGNLATAFKWARARRYIITNPCEFVERPKKEREAPRYLRREEYRKLKKEIDNEEFSDLVDLYLLTGMRRGEGVHLDIKRDIDFDLMKLTIKQPKQSDFRVHDINPDLLRVLRRLILRAGGGNRLVRLNVNTLTRMFAFYANKAGFGKGYTFHILRHTYCTWLASGGATFQECQYLMGHKDPESTRVYYHMYRPNPEKVLHSFSLPMN